MTKDDEDLKKKVINLRLPESLYNQIKDSLGKNPSESLRNHFETMIENKKMKDWTCFFCLNKEGYDVKELYVSSRLVGEDGTGVQIIVCPSCKEKLLNTEEENIKDEFKIWKSLLMEITKNGFLPEYYKLCKYFPKIWKHKKGIIQTTKKLTMEEMKEQFMAINEQEA